MQNFFRPALIMVSTFLLIYIIAFIVQSGPIKTHKPIVCTKGINVSAIGQVEKQEQREIRSMLSPVVYDIPIERNDKVEKTKKIKILPSGEMVP